MLIITKKIDGILKNKSLSHYELCKLTDFHEGSFSMILSGKRGFPPELIKKLLPILEVSREEFDSWVLADKYPKEVLKLAIQEKKDFPYKRKSILTAKIDAVLQERGISRTVFAKQIGYNQSGFNQIVIGKRGMPDSVLKKVANAFEISQDEVLSWIVADRHGLGILERALNIFMFIFFYLNQSNIFSSGVFDLCSGLLILS